MNEDKITFDPRIPFIGPHAENIELIRKSLSESLLEVEMHRKSQRTILNSQMQEVDLSEYSEHLNKSLTKLFQRLWGTSDDSNISQLERESGGTIECWHNRYIAHMLADGLIPAIIGSLIGNLICQNNVTREVSTITTFIEHEVIDTLSKVIGYAPRRGGLQNESIKSGGRLTSCGTIANCEALWIAREKSVSSLGIYKVCRELELLDELEVESGIDIIDHETIKKHFWDLYQTASRIATNKNRNSAFYIATEQYRNMHLRHSRRVSTHRIVFLSSIASHYSLNKNVGLLGYSIPHDSFLEFAANKPNERHNKLIRFAKDYDLWFVDVDEQYRMNTEYLKEYLDFVVKEKDEGNRINIAAVIPTIGSTEANVFDPLHKILEIREHYYKEHNLWFYIHADAAYNGMFKLVENEYDFKEPVRKALSVLGKSDSCTVDPHKLAYIPYPAGALLIKDIRDQQFIKVGANYLFNHGIEDFSIGKASIEGSKPASSATACWLAFLSMTSEDVFSPADALNPCDLYKPIIKKALQNTDYMYEKFKSLKWISIVNDPPEGCVICFQIIPPINDTNLSKQSLMNKATLITFEHFQNNPEKKKFIISMTDIARTKQTTMRIVLMNPFLNFGLIDEFIEEINRYIHSSFFMEQVSIEKHNI